MHPKVSDSEMVVLRTLIDLRETTAASLQERLSAANPWAYSTVMTFLRRLEAKGLVEHVRRAGRKAFLFRPTSRARSAGRTALRRILDSVFGGDPVPLVSSLLEATELKDAEIAQLHRLIDEHAVKGGKKP